MTRDRMNNICKSSLPKVENGKGTEPRPLQRPALSADGLFPRRRYVRRAGQMN